MGNVLTDPPDLVGQNPGGAESSLLLLSELTPDWYRTVKALRGILTEVGT